MAGGLRYEATAINKRDNAQIASGTPSIELRSENDFGSERTIVVDMRTSSVGAQKAAVSDDA
jgi:hypothetical protein